MIKREDKACYPLEASRVVSGGRTIYDRSARGRSWFYLRFKADPLAFITADGSPFTDRSGTLFFVQPEGGI